MIGKVDMYHYRADFIHEGTLKLHLVRDQLIKASELDQYPIRMLQQHAVPHLLKPNVRIMNEEVSLHYEISGKRLLIPLLAVEKISEHQYYEWLLQLISIIENCRAYMLQPNQLLFHEDLLFIEGGLYGGKLCIPYIPLLEPIDPHAAIRGLQQLAISLSGEVKHWSGNGFQELIRLLYQEDVSFPQLRGHVQSYMVPQPQLSTPPSLQAEQAVKPDDRPKAVVTMMHKPASAVQDNNRNSSSDNWWGEQHTEDDDPAEDFEDTTSDLELHPQSWIVAGGIAALAIAAGFKLGYSRSASGIGVAITLLFAVIGISLGYIWRTGWMMLWITRIMRKRKDPLHNDDPFIPDMASVELTSVMLKRSKPLKQKRKQAVHKSMEPITPDDPYPFTHTSMGIGADDRARTDALLGHVLAEQTTMLGESDSATVLLDDYVQPKATVNYVLERIISGRVTEIHSIVQFPFTMGRSEQGVHLTISEPGISKLHCELHYDQGKYWIQDLGSKNGTEVQGELLIPYKKTSIAVNDMIKLAHSEFRFTIAV